VAYAVSRGKLVVNRLLIADLAFLDAHDVFARATGELDEFVEFDQDGFGFPIGRVLE
jgi:hypothetical protein